LASTKNSGGCRRKGIKAIIQYAAIAALAMGAGLVGGCATGSSRKAERGPDGTIAYKVQVESSTPGARVEVNEDYIGRTPLTLTIFGDKDGTFHNFGSKDYIIRAFPVATNQFLQTKVFRTGGWFSEEDRVPSRIYFDMEQPNSGFSIDLKPRY
jgi:hypothetical protein